MRGTAATRAAYQSVRPEDRPAWVLVEDALVRQGFDEEQAALVHGALRADGLVVLHGLRLVDPKWLRDRADLVDRLDSVDWLAGPPAPR